LRHFRQVAQPRCRRWSSAGPICATAPLAPPPLGVGKVPQVARFTSRAQPQTPHSPDRTHGRAPLRYADRGAAQHDHNRTPACIRTTFATPSCEPLRSFAENYVCTQERRQHRNTSRKNQQQHDKRKGEEVEQKGRFSHSERSQTISRRQKAPQDRSRAQGFVKPQLACRRGLERQTRISGLARAFSARAEQASAIPSHKTSALPQFRLRSWLSRFANPQAHPRHRPANP